MRTLKERVASRYLEANENRKSIALISWLSAKAKELRVDEHVYVVGGAVRNFVMEQPIKDVDIMIDSLESGMTAAEFAQSLSRYIPSSNVVENQYGVAIINVSSNSSWTVDGFSFAGEVIEIANARKETYLEEGYKPNEVAPASIEEDVYRREFTFNTLMWRLSEVASGVDKAEIIDITGCGLRDLEKGEMVCPSDPDKTFSDDPTRMVRAVKFLIKYGFTISAETKRSILKNAPLMKKIPSSALSQLMLGTILANERTIPLALAKLEELGLLSDVRRRMISEKPFRSAFENWSKSIGVRAMLDVMDMGLPMRTPLSKYNNEQRGKIQTNVVGMEREEALEYLQLLSKPTTVFSDRRFLMSLVPKDLPKKQIGLWMRKAADLLVEALLDNPNLSEREAKRIVQA